MRRAVICLALALTAAAGTSGQAQAPANPRLVVIVVVDQFRTDYLHDPKVPWLAGFRRLLSEGAFFEHAE